MPRNRRYNQVNDTLRELVKDANIALEGVTIDIQTAGEMIVRLDGVGCMAGHLVDNLGNHAQDLLTFKNHALETLADRKGDKS